MHLMQPNNNISKYFQENFAWAAKVYADHLK